MSENAIIVEGVGKHYKIGTQGGNLRESLHQRIKSFFRATPATEAETFWALQDISFEIKKGEAVGIIGRNGAGKSTLLKILSRITEPSRGRFIINGRVSSLLEVGTGFHPELTGRENIYLNGTILGMSRKEVKAKLEEIVEFSGVRKFIDTPIKHYSSGMKVRLAFSVAAHLEPEILIVDEVLAVGDAEFQKKCLGKMEQVAGEGRTVLFVSHTMNAIEALCERCILLENGQVKADSYEVNQVIQQYYRGSEGMMNSGMHRLNFAEEEYQSYYISFSSFGLTDSQGVDVVDTISTDQGIWIEVEGTVLHSDPALSVGYVLYTEDNTLLYSSSCMDEGEDEACRLDIGKFKLRTFIPGRFLNEGKYRIELISEIRNSQWVVKPGNGPIIEFNIKGGLPWLVRRNCPLAPVFKWKNELGVTNNSI